MAPSVKPTTRPRLVVFHCEGGPWSGQRIAVPRGGTATVQVWLDHGSYNLRAALDPATGRVRLVLSWSPLIDPSLEG